MKLSRLSVRWTSARERVERPERVEQQDASEPEVDEHERPERQRQQQHQLQPRALVQRRCRPGSRWAGLRSQP